MKLSPFQPALWRAASPAILPLVLSVFAFVLSLELRAQCPPPGTIFTNQSQLDAVAANYPDCTVFSGNVVIQEARPGTIKNLEGLSQIQEIDGDLIIRQTRDLMSLQGLGQLQRITGELNVQSNGALASLAGLEQLKYVGSQGLILSNPRLLSLSGLEALETVNGSLYIKKNPALAEMRGLSALTRIHGDLVIGENPSLESLDGLGRLNSIGAGRPRAQLTITENPRLSDITGLSALDFSRLTYLEITKCPSLTTSGRSSQASLFCNFLSGTGQARIFSNGAGFDSLEAVRRVCN